MLKSKICILGVVILMLVTAQIALIKPIKSYPACHTGNAYMGEFWLKQMDVSSADLSYNKTGTIHVSATNDWIDYDGDNNFVANWTIEIGNYHPELNVSMVIEVFYLNNTSVSSMNFYKEIGNASYSTTISSNTICSESGNISVPLSDLNLEEILAETGDDNVTVICLLTGAVVINNTQDTKNLAMMAQDRSVVGVEN
jgi:hypothetical protein